MRVTPIALVIKKMQIKITRCHFILTELAKNVYLEIGPSCFEIKNHSSLQNSRRSLERLLHTGIQRHARMHVHQSSTVYNRKIMSTTQCPAIGKWKKYMAIQCHTIGRKAVLSYSCVAQYRWISGTHGWLRKIIPARIHTVWYHL